MSEHQSKLSVVSPDYDAPDEGFGVPDTPEGGVAWQPSVRTAKRKKKTAKNISLELFALKPKRTIKTPAYEIRYFFLLFIAVVLFVVVHHIMRGDIGSFISKLEDVFLD